MKDKTIYYLFILIGVILIVWSCIVLANTPSKVSPRVEDNVLIEATKTFNLSDQHNLTMYYGSLKN